VGPTLEALQAVKKLMAVAPDGWFVFLREEIYEILIVQRHMGVVYSCAMTQTNSGIETWRVIRWLPGPGYNPEWVEVCGSRWEFLTFLTDELSKL
jgi:hypothetical protein